MLPFFYYSLHNARRPSTEQPLRLRCMLSRSGCRKRLYNIRYCHNVIIWYYSFNSYERRIHSGGTVGGKRCGWTFNVKKKVLINNTYSFRVNTFRYFCCNVLHGIHTSTSCAIVHVSGYTIEYVLNKRISDDQVLRVVGTRINRAREIVSVLKYVVNKWSFSITDETCNMNTRAATLHVKSYAIVWLIISP